MSQSPRLYLLPGMGAAGIMYDPLRDTGLEFEVIEWLQPHRGEKYPDYVRRMVDQIDQSQPFALGGVSFGGMTAVKMCEYLNPEKLILISTVKQSREFPFYMRMLRYFPINRLIPGGGYKLLANIWAPVTVGKMTPQLASLRTEIMKQSDPYLIWWSIDRAIRWRQELAPEGAVHLHGTSDIMFPPVFLQEPEWVKGADHHLVMKSPQIVADFIRRAMDWQQSPLL